LILIMARRRNSRTRTRRRRSTGINLLQAAEMYVTTSIMTEQFAGVNPLEFLTGLEYGSTGSTSNMGKPQMTYGYRYNPSGQSVTLPEILGAGNANFGDGLEKMKENFKANWVSATTALVATKIGFKVAKKITSKQRNFINNKILQPLQLKQMVTV